jgi:O-methyltransferase
LKLKEISLANILLGRKTFTYPFAFTPRQLVFIASCIEETGRVPGCIVEAGCAYGATTVFLNMLQRDIGPAKPYYAIDTFAGFPAEQSEYEIAYRGKPARLKHAFKRNDQSWVDYSVKRAKLTNVTTVKADVSAFDFSSLGAIAFCLIDVDLYLPVRDALAKVYACLSPGGIIVVDDCKAGGNWDGALQAYQEFCAANGLAEERVWEKLGVVRKRPAAGE